MVEYTPKTECQNLSSDENEDRTMFPHSDDNEDAEHMSGVIGNSGVASYSQISTRRTTRNSAANGNCGIAIKEENTLVSNSPAKLVVKKEAEQTTNNIDENSDEEEQMPQRRRRP